MQEIQTLKHLPQLPHRTLINKYKYQIKLLEIGEMIRNLQFFENQLGVFNEIF